MLPGRSSQYYNKDELFKDYVIAKKIKGYKASECSK